MLLYTHEKPSGEIFYVGIGNEKRPFSFLRKGWGCRSKAWWNIVDKHGKPTVRILEENLSPIEAQEKEILLIKRIGRRDLNEGTLVNHTDGGEGVSNWGSLEERNLRKQRISEAIKKWHETRSSELKNEAANKRLDNLTSAELSRINSQSMQTFWKNVSLEEKIERMKKLHEHPSMSTELRSIRTSEIRKNMTNEENEEIARKREITLGENGKKQRSEKMKKYLSNLTPEEKKRRHKKAWETRKKK